MENKELRNALEWIFPAIKSRVIVDDGSFCFRIEKAQQQLMLDAVPKDKIIEYVNEFFGLVGMKAIESAAAIVEPRKTTDKSIGMRRINYSEIYAKNRPEQKKKEDIVWIKFVENGHISVVGVGCDISFTDYAKEHTSAGRIIKALKLDWDDEKILIFPLKNIPKGLSRSDIESGIGNYLISKNVPILDFYSHNF